MFLETIDVRKNDVVIFSRNILDMENNFKIVQKNDVFKKPKSISFFEVADFIKNSVPKNLIVYRLLTNIRDLDASLTKFGFFVWVDGKIELIYFDPVFALEDLNHLNLQVDRSKFRFKIQQVGLKSSGIHSAEASYAQVYSFDLKAIEAQNQDDKIFADAVFAFDNSYNEEINLNVVEYKTDFKTGSRIKKIYDSSSSLIEDNSGVKTDLSKVRFDTDNPEALREQKLQLLKEALGINKSGENISSDPDELIEYEIDDSNSKGIESNSNLIDLFKSTTKQAKVINERERRSVILKLTD